jgi:transposase
MLTVLANLAWWQGDGALARTALERALVVEPGYRLARLLDRLVDLAIRPRATA